MRGEAVGGGAVGHTNRRSAWRCSHLEFPLAFEISFWLIMCLYGCCCVCGVSRGQKEVAEGPGAEAKLVCELRDCVRN